MLFSALFLLQTCLVPAVLAGPFAKVPKEHWTYDSLRELIRHRVLDGPSELLLKGVRVYTRFDMAAMLCPALDRVTSSKMDQQDVALIEKLALEFADELMLMGKDPSPALVTADLPVSSEDGVRAAASQAEEGYDEEGASPDRVPWYLSPDSLRVSMDGDISFLLRHTRRRVDTSDNNWENELSIGFNTFMNIDPRVFAFLRVQNESMPLGDIGSQEDGYIDQLYVDLKNLYDLADIRVGRQYMSLGHSIVLDDKTDGIRISRSFGSRFRLDLFAFDTGNAQTAINEQDYGDASGTKSFWLFDDTYDLTGTANASGTAMTQSSSQGSIANYNSNVNATLPTVGKDKITIFTSPYPEPFPFDASSTTGTVLKTTQVNSHSGIGLQVAGATSLLPLDVYTGAFTAVANGGVADSSGMEIQQMTGAALTRDWQVQSSNGFDSLGARIAADLGAHTMTAYFLQRNYDRYDPYTQLGDPWAAMADTNGDGRIDTDLNGKQVSPSAEPWYLGLTLDGNLVGGLDYFFEYVHFNPDLTNVGVNPLTGTARDALGRWNGDNISTGSAWLLGMDWSFSQRLGLVLQYGAGTEEFLPASIYWKRSFNGMKGRLNTASPSLALGRDYDEGTYSLTGITDFLFKVRAELSDKTRGFALFESVADNDTSLNRLVAGDPDVTGHARQDYSMFTLHLEHSYSKSATVSAEYTYCAYDDPSLDSSGYTGTAASSDNLEWGGWSRIQTELRVSF